MIDENTIKKEMGGEQTTSGWEDQEVLVTSTGTPAPNPKEATPSGESTTRGNEIKETDTHTAGQVGGGSVVRNNHCYSHKNRTHYGTIELQIRSRLTSPNHKVRGDSCPFCDILI